MVQKSTIRGLFGKSPFKALQTHMRQVVKCARDVEPLIQALAKGDEAEVNRIKDRIHKREGKADKIKHKLRQRLPKTLFMPVDRRDLLEILHLQDTIANRAQDIAELLFERKMTIPPFMHEQLIALTARCIDTCELSLNVIEELDELVATGFRGLEVEKVNAMLKELNQLEDETDELGITLLRTLFAHEDEMRPVSVMMWYRLIEWIGDLADYAEKVGDRLRLLIAK